MLPLFVVLCLASTQVWGAALVPGVSHSSSANEDADYAARTAHSDGDGHLVSSSKDYEYTYDRAADNAHNDYAANQAAGLGYGGGAANVAYNNDRSVSYDKGTGSGHEENLDHLYRYNNDEATVDASASASANDDHNAAGYVRGIYKRAVGISNYYGTVSAGFPRERRAVDISNYYGRVHADFPGRYVRSVGYYYGQPGYYGGYAFRHKRSVAYNPAAYYGDYYGYPHHWS